ncbi:MAG: SOS response-associated peptidase [Bacteroidales bacterium]
MCGRYVSVQKIETIEKRFNVTATDGLNFEPSYNIGPGKYAPVITSDKPRELQLFQFGLTPFWAKKRMYLFNARAEGDRNQENDENYAGAKAIVMKPAFRKPIRSQRCLVIADAFIEGPVTERLDKPYVVYLRDNVRPFAFAGIWDEWKSESGDTIFSFAIITTVTNSLLKKIGHNRSPVILPRNRENAWLNSDLSLAEVTRYLEPYPAGLMNAYPISPGIKNPKAEGRSLIDPVGERVEPEFETKERIELELHGMGHYKRGFKH